MEAAGDDRHVEVIADFRYEMAGALPLASGHGKAEQVRVCFADHFDDFGIRHIDRRADHGCFVSVLPEEGCQKGRAQRCHGPFALGIDL